MERTFVMIKPEGIQRRLIGRIISRFEEKGLYLVNSKIVRADEQLLSKHYESLKSLPFYPSLIKHMSSADLMPMVFEGKNAVSVARRLIGATKTEDSLPGTIRGDFGNETGRNLIHGADSIENAKREIELWFGSNLNKINHFDFNVIYE